MHLNLKSLYRSTIINKNLVKIHVYGNDVSNLKCMAIISQVSSANRIIAFYISYSTTKVLENYLHVNPR